MSAGTKLLVIFMTLAFSVVFLGFLVSLGHKIASRMI